MERQKISGSTFLYRAGPILLMAIGIFGILYDNLFRQSTGVLDVFLICFILFFSFIAWIGFQNVDPVFFDEQALYWNKRGVEQKIDYSSIQSFLAYPGARISPESLRVKFVDKDGIFQSIDFYPVSGFTTNPARLLIQCEELIRVQKPDFRIKGSESVLNRERVLKKQENAN